MKPIMAGTNPNLGSGIFFRLLVGTVFMLASGYMGEAQFVPAMIGFIAGMCGWGLILFEIFAGPASKACSQSVNQYVQESFATMRIIVSLGWSIYPLGYFFGYLMGSVDDSTLNLVYNLADFVNKIAFVLAIWHSAKRSTADSEEWAPLNKLLRSAKVSGAQSEAAKKLISNHTRVVNDICNASPITQPTLRRCSPECRGEVNEMMLAVAYRLLDSGGAASGSAVWRDAAAYMAARTQSTEQQCPGRAADMSEAAAAAFLAAVKAAAA